MNYEVKLDFFTGPLDLLLYLVKKEEIPIRDIQMSKITDQYIAFLDTMKELNLEIAGEFVVMAAVLMRIKANELLPKSEQEAVAEDEDFIDREKLIKQIEEYEQYKGAASELKRLEDEHFGVYYRSKPEHMPVEADSFLDQKEVEIYDLIVAFQKLVDNAKKNPVYFMEGDNVTIDDRIEDVLAKTGDVSKVSFTELFADDPRKIVIVVTFMAILELIKMRRLAFRQENHLGEIWLYARDPETEPALDAALPDNPAH